jgi:hypothetical protein
VLIRSVLGGEVICDLYGEDVEAGRESTRNQKVLRAGGVKNGLPPTPRPLTPPLKHVMPG